MTKHDIRAGLGQRAIPRIAFLSLVFVMGVFQPVAMLAENNIYVATNAVGANDGSSWVNAFINPQDAFDAVEGSDVVTTIHLAGHDFSRAPLVGNDFVFRLRNATNIAVRGGYEGIEGGAHDPDQWTTTLARASGTARVLTLANVSNVWIEAMTFRDGSVNGNGGGIHLSGCRDVVFDGCRITDNQLTTSVGYGQGLALVNSTVMVTNSLIARNTGSSTGSATSGVNHGGGASVDGSSRMTVIRSIVSSNSVIPVSRAVAMGGGFYVAAGGVLDIRESVVVNNKASMNFGSATKPQGGAIYNEGTLSLRNVLVAGNHARNAGGWTDVAGDGIHQESGMVTLVNCTIADNFYSVEENSVGIYRASGTITMTNSIVCGHDRDLMNFIVDLDLGIWPGVWYSVIGDDDRNHEWQGCLAPEPLFADRINYHLQSTYGHWTNGYFEGGVFGDAGFYAAAAANSLLIGRGMPDAAGNQTDIGAYGNTEVAAKRPAPSGAPTIANPVVMALGHRSVWMQCEVTDTGGKLPDVAFLYWRDGGATTNMVEAGFAGGTCRAYVSELEPGMAYRYYARASNSYNVVYSGESSFTTHPLSGIDLYVSTNGNHTTGTNWATAYRDLTTALAIVGPGDTLHLAGQNFVAMGPTEADAVFRLQQATNVVIRGGYKGVSGGDGNEAGARDLEQWPTTVARKVGPLWDGRVLVLLNSSNVWIEAVAFRDGNTRGGATPHGGGVLVSGCRDIVFDECRMVDNRLVSTAKGYGGGLGLLNSTVVLTNVLLADNISQRSGSSTATGNSGGGASVDGNSRLTVVQSVVQNNQARFAERLVPEGGGFFVASGGVLDIRESMVISNIAYINYGSTLKPLGGGIYNAGTLSLRNTLLVGNYARNAGGWTQSRGDGIHLAGGVATLMNCTVADNVYGAENSIGIYRAAGTVTVTNTIIWGHADDLSNFEVDGEGALLNVSHSMFAMPGMDGRNGCIGIGDPLFKGDFDYRLQNASGSGMGMSPAIDAGVILPWMIGATDLAGEKRIQSSLLKRASCVDMGAYESPPPQGTLILIQ